MSNWTMLTVIDFGQNLSALLFYPNIAWNPTFQEEDDFGVSLQHYMQEEEEEETESAESIKRREAKVGQMFPCVRENRH